MCTILESICPKVNAIARLEFELANFETSVEHFNYYTTGTPFQIKSIKTAHVTILLNTLHTLYVRVY